nr:DUF86 domain-containing protein [Candidatus Baldrarchaeota archaeon]
MVSESTLRRVERFEQGIKLLEEIAEVSLEEYLRDIKLQSIVERNLQICIEVIIDLSNVIISKKGFRVPSTYKETVEILKENKILEKEFAKKLASLVGLRNIIVHMYADIKSEIIHENLREIINVLKEALKTLLKYCEKNKIDP